MEENDNSGKQNNENIEVTEVNKIQDCIGLFRKLSISKIDDNVNAISNLIYEEDDLLNEFLQKVDCRIEVLQEEEFLKCEHNRDGDSYRSPHNNKYYPPIEDGRYPSKPLRELEIKINKMFNQYARAYYSQNTLSSCYCWDIGEKIEDGFAVAVVIKNLVDLAKEVDTGKWESNNVVHVSFEKENEKIKVVYKLTTSIMLQMKFIHKVCGDVNLSGTVSRQVIFFNF
jgi:capping protein beta